MSSDDEMMKAINAVYRRAILRACADYRRRGLHLSLEYPASDDLFEAVSADPVVKAMLADRVMSNCIFRAWMKSDDVDGMTKQ
jgi:hypothetical protein